MPGRSGRGRPPARKEDSARPGAQPAPVHCAVAQPMATSRWIPGTATGTMFAPSPSRKDAIPGTPSATQRPRRLCHLIISCIGTGRRRSRCGSAGTVMPPETGETRRTPAAGREHPADAASGSGRPPRGRPLAAQAADPSSASRPALDSRLSVTAALCPAIEHGTSRHSTPRTASSTVSISPTVPSPTVPSPAVPSPAVPSPAVSSPATSSPAVSSPAASSPAVRRATAVPLWNRGLSGAREFQQPAEQPAPAPSTGSDASQRPLPGAHRPLDRPPGRSLGGPLRAGSWTAVGAGGAGTGDEDLRPAAEVTPHARAPGGSAAPRGRAGRRRCGRRRCGRRRADPR